jgi:beta-mannosidase
MFVDDWPSITWSVLDYDRQPKAGFYALQMAMQPVLPSINATSPERLDGRRWAYSAPDRITIALSVVNDTLDAYLDAQLRWRIKDGDGQVVMSDAVRINVRADESRSVTSLRPSHLTPGDYHLAVELRDATGQLLGQNAFEFAVRPEEQK